VRVRPSAIADVLLIEPRVFEDERGFLFESWNERHFSDRGLSLRFVQDIHSHSVHRVLRGLHYQIRCPQGKLVRAVTGEIHDVAVDLRKSSPTFGQWVSFRLSAATREMVWIPPGFAHGFMVLSEAADVLYKATDFYAPQHERALAWNDPVLAIEWPPIGAPRLSPKDAQASPLKDAELFE
jgi:dTDP-4-dehydrorhamnose 3,5-epimerase